MKTTRHSSDHFTFKTDDGWEYEAIRTRRSRTVVWDGQAVELTEQWSVTRKSPEGAIEALRLYTDLDQIRELAMRDEPQQKDFYRMACGLPELVQSQGEPRVGCNPLAALTPPGLECE